MKSSNFPIKVDKNMLPLLAVVVLALIVGAVIYTNPSILRLNKTKNLTAQQAGEKAINYINQNILQGQTTASLINSVEENGLYKLTIKVADQEVTTYTTRDGKLLFPQPIDMDSQDNSQQVQNESQTAAPQEIPVTEKPNAKLFIMSFCPYGNQAEEIMMPVVDLLGNKAEIEPHYVIYSNYGGGGPEYCADAENKYCSMHGIQELNQDVREMCVWKYQRENFWTFLKEINKSCTSQNADNCWESVAQGLGMNVQQIKDCQNNESLDLLAAELALNQQYGVTGSPQLLINDVAYAGGRTSNDYKAGICSAFQQQPAECSQALNDPAGTSATDGGCQ